MVKNEVLGSRLKDALWIESGCGMFQSVKQLEELAGDRGHGFAAAHAGVAFAVKVFPVELSVDHAFKNRLREHVAQSGAAALGLAGLALHDAAFVRSQVESAVAHEPTGQPMHDEDQRAKMKEYARWSSFSAANPLLFQE